MDLNDIARAYSIPLQRLQNYEAAGFLRKQDESTYKEADIEQLGLLEVLVRAGFDMEELKRYLALSRRGAPEGKVQLLRDKRREILSNLHVNQTLLEHIDFLIWNAKMKNNGGG